MEHQLKGGGNTVRRIIFPLVLEAFVAAPGAVTSASYFPSSLALVGGHVVVHAWHVAMFKALGGTGARDKDWARLLWQCGLTATLQVRVCDVATAVLRSIAFSEQAKQQETLLADSFLTFALKVSAVEKFRGAPQSQAALAKEGVRYNGTVYSQNMHKTAQLISTLVDKDTRATLRDLETQYGREVLTGSYNKIQRLLQTVQKLELLAAKPADVVLFVVEALYVGLKQGSIAVRAFGVDALERKKDGTAAWLNVTLARFQDSSRG